MALAYDFKLVKKNEFTDDLYVDPIAMDFVVAPSDAQHIQDNLKYVPGWSKEFPLRGWNPYSKINAKNNKQANIQSATIVLQSDGYVKGPQGIDFDLLPSGEFKINVMDVFRP